MPIAAFVFGGRLATNTPLVYQAFDWSHGVFLASTMGSEKTAAAEGTAGEIRRDPFAMLPFCGYNMGDYWAHWLDMPKRVSHLPLIFRVNWFRKDDKGRFMWPGFGENMRVLEWIVKRTAGRAQASETALGWMPAYRDLNWKGLSVSEKQFDALMHVETEPALKDVSAISEHFEQFRQDDRLPIEMDAELVLLEQRLLRRS